MEWMPFHLQLEKTESIVHQGMFQPFLRSFFSLSSKIWPFPNSQFYFLKMLFPFWLDFDIAYTL